MDWTREQVEFWKAADLDTVYDKPIALGTRRIIEMIEVIGERGGKAKFSCKNWDSETGDCTIYDERPMMCRLHGLGNRPCHQEHCGLTQ